MYITLPYDLVIMCTSNMNYERQVKYDFDGSTIILTWKCLLIS